MMDKPGVVSREDVVAFGGIPNPTVMAPRSSERVCAQPNADATRLERAVSQTSKKNVLISPGTNPENLLQAHLSEPLWSMHGEILPAWCANC
jgi:hypothetical protein